jgi:hypothetical protein
LLAKARWLCFAVMCKPKPAFKGRTSFWQLGNNLPSKAETTEVVCEK